MVFNLSQMLKKAGKAVLVAVAAGVLAGLASQDVADAFKEIPYVGGVVFGAFLAGVESLRNFLKHKLGWPL